MAGYAEYKGLPAPRFSVLASGGLLILGGLGVTVGVFPVVAAVALAVFLIVSAVAMHDFWAVPDEDRQDELNSFLKNVTLAGGALVVAASATGTWALSVGMSTLAFGPPINDDRNAEKASRPSCAVVGCVLVAASIRRLTWSRESRPA